MKGRLLVWYLDGFGYRMYEYAKDAGCLTYIAGAFDVSPVSSVSPPLTAPALATMLTGLLPQEHGVTDRSVRKLHILQSLMRYRERRRGWRGQRNPEKPHFAPDSIRIRMERDVIHGSCRSVEREIAAGTGFILRICIRSTTVVILYGPYGARTITLR